MLKGASRIISKYGLERILVFPNKRPVDYFLPPQNVSSRVHKLNLAFTGSANVIFNGSFIYYNKAKEAIVKLDLATKDERCLVIPRGKQSRRVRIFL